MVNCQYGCEEVKEEVRCLCPSTGLQLGPNGRTCIGMCGVFFQLSIFFSGLIQNGVLSLKKLCIGAGVRLLTPPQRLKVRASCFQCVTKKLSLLFSEHSTQ